ncbi:MAG: hypothetical protein K8F35_09665 [Dokdonella sp.]|uniref:hypothetical protein n=1 Tax=Dokdonella sp. TaxID=2291710 RepID=UPI0025B93B79|nr:hypothetical protein [Dokdonella sp.]MBZ0223285.1 hypothetical protein [Dokdonella sp.]
MPDRIECATDFDIGYAIGSLSARKDLFSTVDVIREILGHYHRDVGIPAGSSPNALFGKKLSRHEEAFRLVRDHPDRDAPDDDGEPTTSAYWRPRPR